MLLRMGNIGLKLQRHSGRNVSGNGHIECVRLKCVLVHDSESVGVAPDHRAITMQEQINEGTLVRTAGEKRKVQKAKAFSALL